ncbi:MAG: hypothetical protein EXS63_03440 [Candidatus Omnitrophica bacterium]|nr:hypothetical protein [Candidatus Omnitrophota bacterium]
MAPNGEMTKDQLCESLAAYGYPLLKPPTQPELVIKSLLEQDDFRLLEGFPVVLAHMLQEQETFDWGTSAQGLGSLSGKAQKRLLHFLALSYLLFQTEGLTQGCKSRVLEMLFKFPDGEQVLENVQALFAESEALKVGSETFSVERFKNTFHTYWVQMKTSPKDADLEKKKHDLEFELLLSEVFTPRQKLLLRKRLGQESLTKTEREYFSRVLKKRLRALASDELHRLAQQLMNQA